MQLREGAGNSQCTNPTPLSFGDLDPHTALVLFHLRSPELYPCIMMQTEKGREIERKIVFTHFPFYNSSMETKKIELASRTIISL